MNDKLVAEAKRITASIRSILAGCTTSSILQPVAAEDFKVVKGGIAASSLSSPIKQLFHLLGLLLTTPASPDARSASEAQWDRLLAELEELFQLYAKMYFAEEHLPKARDAEAHRRHGVAMLSYLDRANTYLLLYRDQLRVRIREHFAPFDHEVERELGAPTDVFVRIADWLWDSRERRRQEAIEITRRASAEHARWMASSESLDQFRARMASEGKGELGKELIDALESQNVVDEAGLEREFGAVHARAFVTQFTAERGIETKFELPGQDCPAEARPLIRDELGQLVMVDLQMPFLAILQRLEGVVTGSEKRESYFRHRDGLAERRAAALLSKFFAPEGVVREAVHPTPDSQNEHDALVLWREVGIVVEVKASKLGVPFRDPDKAYPRIENDFKSDSGIQGGHDQAAALREFLLAPGAKALFDDRGRPIVELPGPLGEVLCIVVTADSWGGLATDLTLMLRRREGQPFPWVVSLDQLELTLEAFAHLGKGPHEFVEFLRARQGVQGHAITTDELEIVGPYLENGGFGPEWTDAGSHVTCFADCARIFDRVAQEKRGLSVPAPEAPLKFTDLRDALRQGGDEDSVDLGAVGRNQPCPCGSGKKFKRCHAGAR